MTGKDMKADRILQGLARLAVGRTGADVEQAVRVARGRARREKRALALGDIKAALAGASPQLTGPLRRRFAVHEAGHAIVAVALRLGTITSIRIDATGGNTQINRDLMRDQNEAYFLDELTMTMAGRAAEAEILGSIGAGSGGLRDSDLDHATRIAATMEGALGYGAKHPLIFLSEDALRIRLLNDLEFANRVHGRIELAQQLARQIVKSNLERVENLADALWNAGSVEGQAFWDQGNSSLRAT